MATTTTCPSCNGPLRIPDELVGQRVRCPSCQTIFDAGGSTSAPPTAPVPPPPSAPDPERPLWKDLRLELDNGESARREEAPAPEPARAAAPPPPPPALPSQPRRLVGAVELAPSGGEEPAPRREPPPGPQGREFPSENDDHPRRGLFDRGPRRRDTEPHRGVLVLVLGIISLVCTIPAFCTYGLFGLIGIPLGITAWVLGHRDLGRIKRNEMDEEGLGTTQAGWVCGIVGTILNALVMLSCGGFITFMIISESSNSPMAPKPAFGVPAAPAPPAPPVAPPAMKH